MNVTEKLIARHLVEGSMFPGEQIAIQIDQTLTQDATGTLVMLALESMGLDRVRTEVSVQYVDHNLLQQDHRNPDDHLFLCSSARRFGMWYSPPGNGVSHPLHQECFGVPGKSLLGSDSHTPAAGALGMLAIGAGGMDVALAMAGAPYYLTMPEVWGVRLVGALPDWVSAKDVILEMLRRHGVDGARRRILEYYGPGLGCLTAMDRHVIANMGTELGATSSVFPSDEAVRRFLQARGRASDWRELAADRGTSYDVDEELNLSELVPLVALPSSPANVRPVSEVAGREIYQAYLGSSANPGYRDFAIAAEMVRGRRTHERVSFDVNPTSGRLLEDLIRGDHLGALIQAGARIHQAGCNGCIGMGQAPATDKISLRTVPRNFPGRSGTREDQVYLVSPETATASALAGVIRDPRDMDMPCPRIAEPDRPATAKGAMSAPPAPEPARRIELHKGPNVGTLPDLDNMPEHLEAPILLKVGDDVSTDEILPAGARVLPFRSNIPEISRFVFQDVDPYYAARCGDCGRADHAIVAGSNYGQGSSREHAALAPRYLGLRLVLAESFARIHRRNLVNFGVLPLCFVDRADAEGLSRDELLRISDVRQQLLTGDDIFIERVSSGSRFRACHHLSTRQIDVLLDGGLIRWMSEQRRLSGNAQF